MLSNVRGIDYEAMDISLAGPHGAIVLVDFEAVFPSISQTLLLNTLQKLGLPEEVLQIVRALYWKCQCVETMGGPSYPGIDMSSGVRQGYPLSPLLFVLTVDVFLRALEHAAPEGATMRAFAYDVGMTLHSAKQHLVGIIAVYEDIAKFCGLRLNLGKTGEHPSVAHRHGGGAHSSGHSLACR